MEGKDWLTDHFQRGPRNMSEIDHRLDGPRFDGLLGHAEYHAALLVLSDGPGTCTSHLE